MILLYCSTKETVFKDYILEVAVFVILCFTSASGNWDDEYNEICLTSSSFAAQSFSDSVGLCIMIWTKSKDILVGVKGYGVFLLLKSVKK